MEPLQLEATKIQNTLHHVFNGVTIKTVTFDYQRQAVEMTFTARTNHNGFDAHLKSAIDSIDYVDGPLVKPVHTTKQQRVYTLTLHQSQGQFAPDETEVIEANSLTELLKLLIFHTNG